MSFWREHVERETTHTPRCGRGDCDRWMYEQWWWWRRVGGRRVVALTDTDRVADADRLTHTDQVGDTDQLADADRLADTDRLADAFTDIHTGRGRRREGDVGANGRLRVRRNRGVRPD